jgi:hypothetical protein
VVQLRLERNQALGDTNWILPRIEVVAAKSVRGNVAVSADAGFRLSPARTQALTEMATAFFPRKLANIQSAFRLTDAAWEATLRVERLPQTVLADVFHLFSVAEGVAYGSSLMNYVISGAPVSSFRVELSGEYATSVHRQDVRNWQRALTYLVQLHAPVAAPFALLATTNAVQGTGRDAGVHRRAPAGCAVRVRPHDHHQRVSVLREARGCFARPARPRTGRGAVGVPPVF